MSPRHKKFSFIKKVIPQESTLQKEEQNDGEEKPEVKTDELPHLPAYDKVIFRTFYLPDFLADLVLILFAFFVNDQLFSNEGIFINLQTWQISAMYCIVVLTIPWYLGYLYVRDSVFYNKIVMKIFLWIFILMTLMILIQLMRIALSGDLEKNFLHGINGFTAMFATFLLVLGPMMCIGGAMQANTEFTSKETDPQKFDGNKIAEGPGAFFILIMAIGFMLYIVGLFPANTHFGFLVVVLAMFGGPFLAVVVFGLFLALMKLSDKIGLYKYLRILAINTFPFFIICVLVFWSGVAIYFMHGDFGNASGKISKGAMLFTVIVSGLVPFRIIMLFNAPLRLSNMIMGGISLSYFFWQMFSITY